MVIGLVKAVARCYNLRVSNRSGRIVWPSARDWKSRTGVTAGRGFESHPLRWHHLMMGIFFWCNAIGIAFFYL